MRWICRWSVSTHHRAGPSRCRRDAHEPGRARRFGEGCRRRGGGQVKGGRSRGTKRAGRWCRSRAGRAATPAAAQGPAEGRSAGALTGRADVKGPSRRRPQVPAVGVRLDRGTGGRQPTPGAGEDPGPWPSGAASHQAGRGRRGQGVLVPRQPRPPDRSCGSERRLHPRMSDFGGPLPPGNWGLCTTGAVSARGLR